MKKLIIFILSLAILCALFSVSAMAGEEITDTNNTSQQTSTDSALNGTQHSQAEDERANSEIIKEYLKEKIMPVIIGVLTAICALLATLGKIKRAMCDLGASREELKKEVESRDLSFKEKSEYIQARIDEVKNALKDVPTLKEDTMKLIKELSILKNECEALSKMLYLGFLQSKDVITSGAGKKIVQLAEEISSLNDGSMSVNNGEKCNEKTEIIAPSVDNPLGEGAISDDKA
ncbi:MAG: hypothetical protein J6K52_03515 [Clostridia bacterium]|nr:hypothetical protein [Clostridia bacterium]